MSKDLHSENLDNLLDGILTLRTRDEAYRFFEDLCTVGEIEALQQRFAVARMLRSEQTYQDIAEATGASTATISRVRRALDYGDDGYDLVLKRLDSRGED